MNSVLPQLKHEPKRGRGVFFYSELRFERVLERERELLSRNTRDPTVGSLPGKKESCSTRRGLCVGTGFREFPQTP